MAMLAHKTSFPSTLGGTTQVSSTRDYGSSTASHMTPVMGSTNNGSFASPTESEFSEAYDGPDSVR